MDRIVVLYPLRDRPEQSERGPGRVLWDPGEGQLLLLAHAVWSAMNEYSPIRTETSPAIQGFVPWVKLELKMWEAGQGRAVESRLTKETGVSFERKASSLAFIVCIIFVWNSDCQAYW